MSEGIMHSMRTLTECAATCTSCLHKLLLRITTRKDHETPIYFVSVLFQVFG